MLSNEFCRNDSRYRPPLFDQTCSIMDRDGNVFMAKLAEQVTTFRAAASSRGPPNIRSRWLLTRVSIPFTRGAGGAF